MTSYPQMATHRNNFTMPAQLIFKPFETREWEIRTAKLLEWRVQKRPMIDDVMVRREGVEDTRWRGTELRLKVALDLERGKKATEGEVSFDETGISSVLGLKSEPRQNSREVIGQDFPVFICKLPSSLKPGDKAGDAWTMRKEFLGTTRGDESAQLQGLLQFLNKWGEITMELHGMFDPDALDPRSLPGWQLVNPLSGYSIVFPHLLLEMRKKYRQALLAENAEKWLSTAGPLTLSQIDKPPYFLVVRNSCQGAIEATITIDHLADRRFGFCQKCGKEFEQRTKREKNYCERSCINAANVQSWRERQCEKAQSAGKDNAKS